MGRRVKLKPRELESDVIGDHIFCAHNISSAKRAVDACSLDHVTRILVRHGGKVGGVILVEHGNVMLYSDDNFLMDSVIGICDGP